MKQRHIFVISGGTGASGAQLVRTALAQYERLAVPLTIIPHVHTETDLSNAVEQAARSNGFVVHTLVDPALRSTMAGMAHARGLIAVDAMGALLHHLTHYLGQPALGEPGRYRQLREDDLRRIEAIEFAVEHDDGKRSHELHLAEIVLVGVSRVGKTPISVYLATRGWNVANIPLAPEINPPEALFALDKRKVTGLTISPGQLVHFRRHRERHLGAGTLAAYAVPASLLDELKFAETFFRKNGFAMVDMTDKPIEEAGDEIVALIRRRQDSTQPI